MPIFWRINSNELTPIFETPLLGFPIEDPSFISDEYLDKKEFIVFRTCHSIGDWGIISAMPKLLKQKYPDCKIYVPSSKLISKIFGGFNNWNHWNNPFENAELVFKNNPYVDEFIDDIEDEVFHDHYRIYDLNNIEVPLIIQMLKFWQFTDEEIQDYLPELYFSPEEIKIGNKIIETYTKREFGTLLLTNTVKEYYSDDINNLLLKELEQYKDLIFFYYGSKDIKDTIFNSTKCINFKDLNIPIRIQLYIKTKALVNIGYQSGVNDSVCRYSKVICTPSTGVLGADYLGAIKYLK
jgi:hypothetical protein